MFIAHKTAESPTRCEDGQGRGNIYRLCADLLRSRPFVADKERQDDSQTIPWALRENN